MAKATDGDRYLCGLLPGVTLASGSRLPDWMQKHLPVDTVEAARVPASVHVSFRGDASQVRVRLDRGARAAMCAPTLPDAVVAWQGETIIGRAEVPDVHGPVDVELDLLEHDAERDIRLALPEVFELRSVDVRLVGGAITPAPPRPRLVAYGDSITQNWSVTTPGGGWASRVAERLGFELVNMGFAGSARGEVLAALAVAQSEADAVILAWGTNAWSRVPTDEHTIAATLRLFLRAVTEQLPNCPVLVLSPLVRPEAEQGPNAFGVTQSQLRIAIEQETQRFRRETGTPHVEVLSGLGIVEPGQLVDGTHPGDEGNLSIATAVTDALGRLIR